MLRLRHDTPPEWVHVALGDLDAFLQDHAANERKVSHSALTLATQHPQHRELVDALVPLAEEELRHFRQVYEFLVARGSTLGFDQPDPYTGTLFRAVRTPDAPAYLLGRLVLFGIIEARGCERFALMADALPAGDLKSFYAGLVRSESQHHATYLRLAHLYFPERRVSQRLDELLDIEAQVARDLPLRPALH